MRPEAKGDRNGNGNRGEEASRGNNPQATKIGRVYVGSILPAHEARIAGQLEAIAKHNIEHSQLVLGYQRLPAIPDRWRSFTDVLSASSFWEMVLKVKDWCDNRQFDVLHLHALWAGLIGGIAARLTGGRPVIVYEIHGALAFESRLRNRGWTANVRFAVLYILESLTILLADRLLLVSEELVRYYPIARLRPRIAIPRVIQDSTLAISEQPSSEIEALEEYANRQRNAGRKVLVYSGGLSAWQMFEETVQQMARCINAGIAAAVILTNDKEAASRIVARYVVGQERVYIGTLRQSEVIRGLQACDVGFLLRADNVVNRVASPTKFFEYLAAGLYVITTPGAGTVAPLVERHRLGLVIGEDTQDCELVEWLATIKITEEEKQRIRRLAAARYTWSGCCEKLLQLYEPRRECLSSLSLGQARSDAGTAE